MRWSNDVRTSRLLPVDDTARDQRIDVRKKDPFQTGNKLHHKSYRTDRTNEKSSVPGSENYCQYFDCMQYSVKPGGTEQYININIRIISYSYITFSRYSISVPQWTWQLTFFIGSLQIALHVCFQRLRQKASHRALAWRRSSWSSWRQMSSNCLDSTSANPSRKLRQCWPTIQWISTQWIDFSMEDQIYHFSNSQSQMRERNSPIMDAWTGDNSEHVLHGPHNTNRIWLKMLMLPEWDLWIC